MAAQYRPCDSGKEINIYCPKWNECSDGSCLSNQSHTINRDGCTGSSSGANSSCIKLCNAELESETNENDVKNATSEAFGITICENGSYCCGNSDFADTCCTLKQALFAGDDPTTQQNSISFQNFLPSLTLTSSIGVSASITSFSEFPTRTPLNSPSNSTSSSQKGPLQIGTIVGGTVGSVGGIAALTLCALAWKSRQRRIQQNHQNQMLQRPVISSPSMPFELRDGESVLQSSELYANNGRREMEGTDLTLELDPSRTWHEVQ